MHIRQFAIALNDRFVSDTSGLLYFDSFFAFASADHTARLDARPPT
jgi:hypothetical protein